MACAEAAAPPPEVTHGFWSLFDGSRLPFVPVPEIDVDPYSGTTLGLIPVWIVTDEQQQIRRIVAPDVIHSRYFGYGARARIFAFPSEDVLWSVVGGGKQRVEREFDARYEAGRLRTDTWSMALAAVFDRSGTPHFYGLGNRTRSTAQTNYTRQVAYLQATFGRNFTPRWQLSFTLRAREVDVTHGSLASIPSTEARFGRIAGFGTGSDVLNRLAAVFDTRDSETIPRRGLRIAAYLGTAAAQGSQHSASYGEGGFDARGYWQLQPASTLAAHVAARYLYSGRRAPFWALSSIGGDDASDLDGSQPFRGFGESRFVDRHAFAANFEWRRKVGSADAVGTHIDLELTPFVDVGKVFARSRTSPLSALHAVGGVGLRGSARPNVVGYVDFGYGSDGLAVFTGINYPF